MSSDLIGLVSVPFVGFPSSDIVMLADTRDQSYHIHSYSDDSQICNSNPDLISELQTHRTYYLYKISTQKHQHAQTWTYAKACFIKVLPANVEGNSNPLVTQCKSAHRLFLPSYSHVSHEICQQMLLMLPLRYISGYFSVPLLPDSCHHCLICVTNNLLKGKSFLVFSHFCTLIYLKHSNCQTDLATT